MDTHSFEQLAVLNQERHHELLSEAAQQRLLSHLSIKSKHSNLFYQFLACFTHPSLHIRYSIG